MLEDAAAEGDRLLVRRAVVPGENLTQAGTDLAGGRPSGGAGAPDAPGDGGARGLRHRARPRGAAAPEWRCSPRGTRSSGPARRWREGLVRDVNARAIADAVRGRGEPEERGVVPDRREALEEAIRSAAGVLRSRPPLGRHEQGGGGSRRGGAGGAPGGACPRARVALSREAAAAGRRRGDPRGGAPRFPTSAIFTFHEFVAPEIRRMAGLPEHPPGETIRARLAVRLRSKKVVPRLLPRGSGARARGAAGLARGEGVGLHHDMGPLRRFLAVPRTGNSWRPARR